MRGTRSQYLTCWAAVALAGPLPAQECHFEFADVSTGGVHANQLGWVPQVSGDGRFVAFDSLASNLVPGDTNGGWDVFVRDLLTKTTERVSVGSNGQQVVASEIGGISYDGRYVSFTSWTDLDPLDQNGVRDAVVVNDSETACT